MGFNSGFKGLKNGYCSAGAVNVMYKPAFSTEIQGSITVIAKRYHCITLQSTLINQVYSFYLVDCTVCKQV